MKLTPYLNFNGNCESAFLFYSNVFEGEIGEINRYEGSPMDIPEGMENKVMHVGLKFEENEIMGCDDLQAKEMPANSPMMLSFVEVFVMDRIFNNLSQGGTVTMPLQDTFWGARFGMITDKFGIRWMFNCDLN
ncbi:MAG: VOC family protein [Bacteroidia bacterium]|jgi:PhnB protein|nr:VOC family protein [Bacteroidia bacterium]